MNSLYQRMVRAAYLGLLALATISLTGCGTTPHTFAAAEPAGTASPSGATLPAGSTPVSAPPLGVPADVGSSTNRQGPYWVSPGNRITITFSGIPNPPPKHEEKVREDGCISPPFLGRPVMAAGKTIGKLQEELQNLYVPDYYTRALTVTLTREELWFFVGGEVRNPNRYIYSGELTVLKAIQTAGGFTEYARRGKVQVTRANGHKEKPVDCGKAIKNPRLDLPIFPGDQVYVDRRPI